MGLEIEDGMGFRGLLPSREDAMEERIWKQKKELTRLRDEVARLKAENVALQKQLCNYQLAEIGSKLVEEMEDDEDAATR